MKRKCAIILIATLVMQLLFCDFGVYKKTVKAAALTLHNPTMINGISTWDCVYFGNYWQDDTNGDGLANKNDAKKPIKWRVLQVDGDDVFLMSDKTLDCQKYHASEVEITWENCDLRKWLYSSFYRNAFSEEEQNAIKVTTVENDKNEVHGTPGGNTTEDKVYIPSIKEISNTKYGFTSKYSVRNNTRIAKNTLYSAQLSKQNDTLPEYGAWWLRTPGALKQQATLVDGAGLAYGGSYYTGWSVAEKYFTVRPVLHLSLSAAKQLEFAGTVSSDGVETTLGPTITPTETPVPTASVIPSTQIPIKNMQTPNSTNSPKSRIETQTAQVKKTEDTIRAGKTFVYKGISYRVTKISGKKGNLTLKDIKNKRTKKVVIPKEMKKYGIKFVVTQIGKNVFTKCKKLKKLTIKSRTITKMEKNRFAKKCKIIVPQAMKKKYIKLLAKCRRN